MEKKQTAVDWLIESIEEQAIGVDHANSRIHISISFEDFMYMKKQAKALEREQIEKAYGKGVDDGIRMGAHNRFSIYNSASDYFTKTYGE